MSVKPEKYTCTWCGGAGGNLETGDMCNGCDGTGVEFVKRQRECENCRGEGRVYKWTPGGTYRLGETCPVCRGRRYVEE